MESPQQNFITRVAQQARKIRDTYPMSEEIDVLYKGSFNYEALITQEEIDSVPSFKAAGLTVAKLGAAIYILKMIKLIFVRQ